MPPTGYCRDGGLPRQRGIAPSDWSGAFGRQRGHNFLRNDSQPPPRPDNPRPMMQHSANHAEVRDAVSKLCSDFPGEYWRKLDREMAYPTEFVEALTQSGFLAALIPEEFGGAGLPLSAAAVIMEEIQRQGCNGAACHAQMYVMGTVL